jgi:hypothetical protein
MALFDLNRSGETAIATNLLASITPKNTHVYPAPITAAMVARVDNPTVTYTGGAALDVNETVDYETGTANVTGGAMVPATQNAKLTAGNLTAGTVIVDDVGRRRGWLEPDDPYVAAPGAGANPTITSLAPNTAVAVTGPDLVVTITGTNFTQWSTVTSGNFPIPCLYVSSTKLTIIQKPRTSVAGTVSVVVTDHGVASAGSNFVFT